MVLSKLELNIRALKRLSGLTEKGVMGNCGQLMSHRHTSQIPTCPADLDIKEAKWLSWIHYREE